DLGAWADDGTVAATTAARHSQIAMAKRQERFIVLLSLRRPSGRLVVVDRAGVGNPSQNVRHARWSDNPSAPPHPHAARYRRRRCVQTATAVSRSGIVRPGRGAPAALARGRPKTGLRPP